MWHKIDKNIPIIKETELGNGTSVWRSQGEFVVGGTVSDTLGLSKDGFTLTVNDEPVVLTGTNLSEVATAENGDKYYTWNCSLRKTMLERLSREKLLSRMIEVGLLLR